MPKGNVRVEGKIVYLPVYMTMFIDEPPLPGKVSVPDLSGLMFDE